MADRGVTVCLAMMKGLRLFMRPNAPLRQIMVFLYVAEHEPVTAKEVAAERGFAPGTVYEDLKALGKRDVSDKEGAGLITELPGGPDSPAHRFTLSPRGKMAVDRIELEMAAASLVIAEDDDEPLEGYFEAVGHTRC